MFVILNRKELVLLDFVVIMNDLVNLHMINVQINEYYFFLSQVKALVFLMYIMSL